MFVTFVTFAAKRKFKFSLTAAITESAAVFPVAAANSVFHLVKTNFGFAYAALDFVKTLADFAVAFYNFFSKK